MTSNDNTNQSRQRLNLPDQDNYNRFFENVARRENDGSYCKMCERNDYHCKQCKHRCHKKCQGHTHRCSRSWVKRSSSFNRVRSGEEHWTKVLQANEGDLLFCARHCASLVSSPRSATDKEFGGFLNVNGPSTAGQSTSSSVSRASSFASYHCGQKSQQQQAASSTSSAGNSLSSKEQVQNGSKEKTVFHSLYSRFVNWIQSNKLEANKQQMTMTSQMETRNSYNSKSLTDDNKDSPFIGCSRFQSGEGVGYRKRFKKRPKTISGTSNLSSSESEMEKTTSALEVFLKTSRWRRQISRPPSTCSSVLVTSPCTSPTSDCQPYSGPDLRPFPLPRSDDSAMKLISTFPFSCFPAEHQNNNHNCSATPGSSSLGSRSSLSSLSSQKSPGINLPGAANNNNNNNDDPDVKRASFRAKPTLISSSNNWMSKDTLVNSSMEKDSLDVSDTTSICTVLDNCEPYLRDALKDWNISFTDIKLKESFKQGTLYSIYKGQWHGDILVYLYNSLPESKVPWFLREVSRLSKIRHENICLFMGACFSNNNMAVVTSELKGMSVYEKLHLCMDRVPSRTRVNIARYVAQAVGYLHAKNITTKTLNTRNVYFEPKVKLSLLDHANNCPLGLPKRKGTYVARGTLSYYAPELLKRFKFVEVEVDGGEEEIHTFQTDSYAFGTLLYELLSCHLALKGLTNEELIWQVCYGKRQRLSLLGCNPVLKVLIDRCWSHDPAKRPSFIEINQELMQKTGLHKRHSSSQPEKLDRHGSFSFQTRTSFI